MNLPYLLRKHLVVRVFDIRGDSPEKYNCALKMHWMQLTMPAIIVNLFQVV